MTRKYSVFPARAGMSPKGAHITKKSAGVPRASGDEPERRNMVIGAV